VKTELQQYKDDEMIQLIRETVNDLHVIGDRLERYASGQVALKQQQEQGEQGE
jgi:hypothetical protein